MAALEEGVGGGTTAGYAAELALAVALPLRLEMGKRRRGGRRAEENKIAL